jgi:hypothetical protein
MVPILKILSATLLSGPKKHLKNRLFKYFEYHHCTYRRGHIQYGRPSKNIEREHKVNKKGGKCTEIERVIEDVAAGCPREGAKGTFTAAPYQTQHFTL